MQKLGFENEEDFTSNKQSISNKIAHFEGIVIRSRFFIDRSFLEKAKHLKFIIRVGAGLENIDTSFAKQNNIYLINAPEGNRDAVGEHCIGMLLTLFNKINFADSEIRKGLWQREQNRGVELKGKTIGLIGYGNMGKSFAKKLQGFEVNVLCYDIKDNVGDRYALQVSLKELQQKSDVVSIHTSCNELSKQMVNTCFINNFSNPFYLINTARGSSVVTKDLVKALEDKKILGACLDVLEYEKTSFEIFFENQRLPKDFEYLLHSQKVLLSPHVAGWTDASHYKLAKVCVDKLTEFLSIID